MARLLSRIARTLLIVLPVLTTVESSLAARLRIGWQSADVNVILTWAIATKAFEAAGLNPELKAFPSGPALLPAFAAGEIDIGFMGEFPAATGFANGLPLGVFVLFETYPSNVRLIVNPAKIRSLTDLKGRRVAVTIGSTSHYHILRALDRAGLSQTDVTIVNLAQPNMVAAYVADQVDAVVAWEPAAGETEKAGGATLATTESLGTLVTYVIVGRREYLESQKDTIQTFLHVWENALNVFKENPAAVIPFEARRIGKTVEEYQELLNRQNATRPSFANQLSTEYLGRWGEANGSRFAHHLEDIGMFLLKLNRVNQVPSDWAALIDQAPLHTYLMSLPKKP
jgi:ABC-type nitrate/sulfonate/bicarbonate transport system substrate-binding protein